MLCSIFERCDLILFPCPAARIIASSLLIELKDDDNFLTALSISFLLLFCILITLKYSKNK